MSTPTYSFLPWLRSGVAGSIKAADGDVAVKVRAALPLDLTLSGTKLDDGTDNRPVHHDVHLYGPGDVIGIDSRAVVKAEPRNWITNFEPNYLPYVEFYDEDLPWRYTPAAADDAKHRLRPWITLVVLKETEFTDGKDMRGKPLPYLELVGGVDPAKVFPKPSELWAWAHVHSNVDLASNDDVSMPGVLAKLEENLGKNPDLAYSRLLSPRRLESNVAYHGFVIPTFESGRLAGLGATIPDTLVATTSAWDQNQNQFPYYHRWYFKTGNFGNFEYLVRLLVPRPVDKRVGVRDIDVLHPGSNLPAISTPAALGGVLKLGGSLRVPFESMSEEDQQEVTKYDQWDEPYPHAFEQAMAALVDLADDYARAAPENVNPDGDPDPVVTLPLYGRWPALVGRVLTAPDGTRLPHDRNWIHRLNLDPRFRVAAGIGTRVVQQNDQKYMAAAWQQVGDVVSANALLRSAQLGVVLLTALHERHVAALASERQFLLTAPVHARVMGSPTTVAAQVSASVVPPVVTSGVFRRITRPGAPLMKRLGLPAATAAAIVTGINAGKLRPAPPKQAPSGAAGIGAAVQAIRPADLPTWLEEMLGRNPWVRFLPFLLLLILVLGAFALGLAAALVAIAIATPLMLWLFRRLSRWTQAAGALRAIREEQQTPASIDALPAVQNFAIAPPGTPPFTPEPGPADNVEAANFKRGLRDAHAFTSVRFPIPEKRRLDLPALTRTVVDAIRPALTIPRRMKRIVYLPPWLVDEMVEQFTPCMAYPGFDVPMYKPLSELSAELFLPNINLIAQNSMTLMEPNQRFIESYMVGLNHEMARELLWNEYPTDQRGSYFRQFWAVDMNLPPNPTPAEKEALRDIPELHKWSLASNLGTHDHRSSGGTSARLVLVIRGDLLKRYPNTVIYAQKARWQEHNGTIDTSLDRVLVDLAPGEEEAPPKSKVRLPLFEAKVDPDIYFIGFELKPLEAKGGSHAGDDPGWFFVLKERPGEPRFGMDDVPGADEPRLINWNDLAWREVGTTPGETIHLDATLAFDAYIPALDLENKPDPADVQAKWSPDTNAADLAYILYRVPVLFAVHASRMLP